MGQDNYNPAVAPSRLRLSGTSIRCNNHIPFCEREYHPAFADWYLAHLRVGFVNVAADSSAGAGAERQGTITTRNVVHRFTPFRGGLSQDVALGIPADAPSRLRLSEASIRCNNHIPFCEREYHPAFADWYLAHLQVGFVNTAAKHGHRRANFPRRLFAGGSLGGLRYPEYNIRICWVAVRSLPTSCCSPCSWALC
jgi:hypothetical protein